MINVYLNYPNPRVVAHCNPSCSQIKKQRKIAQRIIPINQNTIVREIKNFSQGVYRFGSNPQNNDMWLDIDFYDKDFELVVASYIHKLLSNSYSPFANTQLVLHDCDKF